MDVSVNITNGEQCVFELFSSVRVGLHNIQDDDKVHRETEFLYLLLR